MHKISTTLLNSTARMEHGRQPVLYREINDPLALSIKDPVHTWDKCVRSVFGY